MTGPAYKSHASVDTAVVAAVISVFRAPSDLVEKITALLSQVDEVVVVDDGSHTVERFPEIHHIAHVIITDENRGIAAALNSGIRVAIENGADFVLTMDQDSLLIDNYITCALKTYRDAQRAGLNPGLVSAETHNGLQVPAWGEQRGFQLLFDPMQSGTLFPMPVLKRLGLFDEELFIDGVDTEYNIRLKAAGYTLLAGQGCDLHHALGEARPLRVLGWQPRFRGRPMEILYHAPFRTYYITRNNTVLRRRYGGRDRAWMLRRQIMELESAVICLVYGPKRREHLTAMWRGWLDGLQGRLGRIPARLQSRIS
jgi:rhamnosyltransferase